MLQKLMLLFRLFRQGEAVADPKAWVHGQISANALAAVLATVVLLAQQCGANVHASSEQLLLVAGGVLAGLNIVLPLITHERVGLPPAPEAAPHAGPLAAGTVMDPPPGPPRDIYPD